MNGCNPPTRRRLKFDVVILIAGFIAMIVGLAEDIPAWVMLIIGWTHGGLLVFIMADIRDIHRREAGLLRDFGDDHA